MQDIIIVGIIMTIVTAPRARIKANSLINTKTVITNLILVLLIRIFVRDISIIRTMVTVMVTAIANIVGIIIRFTMSNKKPPQ
jgi:hypothetical protein